MKYLIAIMLMSNIATAKIGTDKFAHIGLSYVFSETCSSYLKATGSDNLERFVACTVLTLAVTGFKEAVFDSHFDENDMLANGLGAITPSVRFILFEF